MNSQTPYSVPAPRYGDLILQAWSSMQPHLPLLVGLTLVYVVSSFVLGMIPMIGPLAGMAVAPGYVSCLVKLRDQGQVEYRDFFWAFMDFNRLINLAVLMGLKFILVAVGTLCFVIPGIYLAISFCFADVVFALHTADGVAALRTSYDTIKNHWWYVFGLLIVGCLLCFAGTMAFGVGVLLALPVVNLMYINAFGVLSGRRYTLNDVSSSNEPISSF